MNAIAEQEVIRLAAVQEAARPRVTHGSGCSVCAMRQLCMPLNLDARDLVRLETIIGGHRTVRRGDALYRNGDPFNSLYAIRAGSFKTVVMHRDGDEQVTGFYLPGDPLGVDGVCEHRHACDAIALEDSSVCLIPFVLFDELCHDVRPIQQHFYRILGDAIGRESDLLMLLGTMSAEQRVAAFLLNLSDRFRARGFSPNVFSIHMTREEIGHYLGIKLETVSRMLSKFQKDGLIEARGKSITLVNRDALQRI